MTIVKEQTLQQRQVLVLVLVGIVVISVLAVSVSILIIYPPKDEKAGYTGPVNILFIVVDDLRPALGCYGDKRAITPNIDSLAGRSIIFKNAYAQQALCAPSRTSFLTSRRPDTLCLYDDGSYWRDTIGNFTTIPQHFKNHGYETISIGKVFHHGVVSNHTDDYPYSWSEYPYRPPTEAYKMAPVNNFYQECPGTDGKLHMNLVCPVDVQGKLGHSLPDIESTEYAIEYLKSKSSNSSVPFFLGVGYYKPHIPFKFPKEYLDLYPLASMDLAPNHTLPKKLNNVTWNPWMDIREREDVAALNVPFPFGPLPEDFQKLARQGYYASLSYMDDQLGRLLETLEETGFAESTAIVLLGDHGWSLGEHQEWSKYSNYEVSLKVPLIIYVPGLTSKDKEPFKHIPVLDFLSTNETFLSNMSNSPSGSKSPYSSDELVELVDLFPTLAEIVNISVPPLCRLYPTILCSEGISFYQVIKHHIFHPKDDFTWKTGVFSQYPRPSLTIQGNSDQPDLKDINIMGYSIRTERFRYTQWVSFNNTICKPQWHHVVAQELYDHKYDPFEVHNLYNAAVYDNIVKELSKKIRRGWRHALPHHLFGDL